MKRGGVRCLLAGVALGSVGCLAGTTVVRQPYRPTHAPPPADRPRPEGQAGFLGEPVGSEYQWEASIGLALCIDASDFQLALGGRYYFDPIDNSDEPYRLQSFFQRATYAEAVLELGPAGASLLDARGRYVFPEEPIGVTATLGSGTPAVGEALSLFGVSVGGVYWLLADENLAAEVSIGGAVWREGGPGPLVTVNRTVFDIGARWVTSLPETEAVLEVCGRIRLADEEGVGASGLAFKGRYFFNKDVFAGFEFSTEGNVFRGEANRFAISGGYAAQGPLHLEAQVGTDDALGGGFVRFGANARF